jgi:H+/Cl- antiporter ClcA/CBS domain-containing protein
MDDSEIEGPTRTQDDPQKGPAATAKPDADGFAPTSSSTTGGLPVAPSMGPLLQVAQVERRVAGLRARTITICLLAMLIGLAAAAIAQLLAGLIGLITNLAFYGRISTSFVSPANNKLGLAVIAVPVLGGLVVGLMARYGSRAIRGHGIPEAMEQVLFNQSRIPPRMTFLKPLSAAIAIGTGGPFGAEGPIIATGGALGSLVGQLLKTTADERKTLLAAGAAAGMAATFGSPVAAVLLAIELLLFEYRPRSILPVALASSVATAVHIGFVGHAPAFSMRDVVEPTGFALASYIGIGALAGLASVYVTRAVYWVEDGFEKLPIHWMWWPAIGAVGTGLIGYFVPRTLGVGYDNIDGVLNGTLAGQTLVILGGMKLVSWLVSLGSGTSGGTLAPLLTIGGALGASIAAALLAIAPDLPLNTHMAALVGMAALFAGASRAYLTSVVFAFEATRQPLGLLPLLGGCGAAFLVSSLLMKHTIMTEKIARRGARVPDEYQADHLDTVLVREQATADVIVFAATDPLSTIRAFLASDAPGSRHQAFPVVDAGGSLVGVITQYDVETTAHPSTEAIGSLIRRPAIVAFEDESLREAADRMVLADVGRLPVVSRNAPRVLVGILTRSDLLAAHGVRIDASSRRERHLHLRRGSNPPLV